MTNDVIADRHLPLFYFFRRHSFERADRAAALQMVVVQPHFLFGGGVTLFRDQVHFFQQPEHGEFPVAGLRPFLAGHCLDSGRQMDNPDGGIGLVHVLAARTGCPAGLDFEIGGLDRSRCVRLEIEEGHLDEPIFARPVRPNRALPDPFDCALP